MPLIKTKHYWLDCKIIAPWQVQVPDPETSYPEPEELNASCIDQQERALIWLQNHFQVQCANPIERIICVQAAGFGHLKDGYMTECSTALARKLLEKPTAPILTALGSTVQYEIAIGLNGRLWIHAQNTTTTILVANAILRSEFLSATQCSLLVKKLAAVAIKHSQDAAWFASLFSRQVLACTAVPLLSWCPNFLLRPWMQPGQNVTCCVHVLSEKVGYPLLLILDARPVQSGMQCNNRICKMCVCLQTLLYFLLVLLSWRLYAGLQTVLTGKVFDDFWLGLTRDRTFSSLEDLILHIGWQVMCHDMSSWKA